MIVNLSVLSCTTSPLEKAIIEEKINVEFHVKEMVIAQGHVDLFTLQLPDSIQPLRFNCNGKDTAWWPDGHLFKAFIAVPMDSTLEEFGCVIKYSLRNQQKTSEYEDVVAKIKITPYDWEQEILHVIKKLKPRTQQEQDRIEREWLHLKNVVYASSNVRPYFKTAFARPLNSAITSSFGRQRLYNKIKKSQHSGVDFRSPIGTPIRASNAGKVVFAGDLFYSGNTVILDHGVGIYTLYAHLSKFTVVEGEFIPQGGVLGLAGMTGRVTGPHLHWGVKVNGIHINGLALTDIPLQ